MRRICKDQLVREIWDSRAEQIQSIMAEKGWISCPYTYENFKQDMMRRELLVDERTIRTKWELLVSTGVLRETAKNRGELAFVAFRDLMPSRSRLILLNLIEETKTASSHAEKVRA